MHTSTLRSLLIGTAVALSAASGFSQTTIWSDNFDRATLNGGSLNWTAYQAASLPTLTTVSPISGTTSLVITGNSNGQAAGYSATPAVLGATVGSSLTLSVKFNLATNPTGGGQVRFALMDSKGSVPPTNNYNSGSPAPSGATVNDDRGFYFQFQTAASGGVADPFSLLNKSMSGTIQNYVSGTNGAAIANSINTVTNPFNVAINNTSVNTISLSFLRVTGGTVITGFLNGTKYYESAIQATLNASQFDIVAIGNNTGPNIRVDDISVVTAVPEPSAYAVFAGLGAIGLVASRRRRRA